MKIKVIYFIVVCSFILCPSSLWAQGVHEIKELNGSLIFKEVRDYRIAPRLLIQQAKDSLPHVEKNVEFLCERFYGFLYDFTYSMLCYTSNETKDRIKIFGQVKQSKRLWNYEIYVAKEDLPNKVMLILESLSKFTYNKFKNENAASGSDASSTRPF